MDGMTLRQLLNEQHHLQQQIKQIKAKVQPELEPLEMSLGQVNDQINAIATEASKAAFLAAGKDTGTLETTQDGVRIKTTVGKTVKWDQGKLADIGSRIEVSGDDPGQYIKTAYSVEERAYSTWPDAIKKVFDPAREVKPGKPKFEFLVIPDSEEDIPF